jgi:hypothetical protein
MDRTIRHIYFCLHNLQVIERRSVKATAWHQEKAFWEAQIAVDLERLRSE